MGFYFSVICYVLSVSCGEAERWSPNSMTAQESTGPVVRDVTPSAWSYAQHGKIMGISHGNVMGMS